MIVEIIILLVVSLNLLLNLVGNFNQTKTADKRWDLLFKYLENNEKDRLKIINQDIQDFRYDLSQIKKNTS